MSSSKIIQSYVGQKIDGTQKSIKKCYLLTSKKKELVTMKQFLLKIDKSQALCSDTDFRPSYSRSICLNNFKFHLNEHLPISTTGFIKFFSHHHKSIEFILGHQFSVFIPRLLFHPIFHCYIMWTNNF